ncbi:MAG TPA: pentapeptide repeat-containing protein, partial [bacterium]|nr:pentapeptide repeat-containing protein [bacterium]
MKILIVFILGTVAVPGFAPGIPGSATGSISDLAPVPSASASLILPATPIPSTIAPNEVSGMSEPEYRSRMYELEREKHSLERERYNVERKSLLLSWFAAVSGFGALVFLGWRVVIMAKQAKEQELASYRERLFSEDSSARIAAAMSLSKYPKEAIWLVSRWAREHKLLERANSEAESGNEIKKVEASDHEQVKKAIEDALGIMAWKGSWDWKRLGWFTFRIPSRFVFWRITGRGTVSFPLFWPYRARGPRLDRLQMTIEIGPIMIPNAYLHKSRLHDVNLQGAYLVGGDLQRVSLSGANLQGSLIMYANLQNASFWGAD